MRLRRPAFPRWRCTFPTCTSASRSGTCRTRPPSVWVKSPDSGRTATYWALTGSSAICGGSAPKAKDKGDPVTERIDRLRERMKKESVDALFLDSPENRRYLTGFTGSAGIVVVGHDAVYLIADFRYFDQVKAEAPRVELV